MSKPVPGFDIGVPSATDARVARPKRPYAGTPGFDVSDDTATPNTIPDLTRSLRENSELVQDLCRYAENLASESAIRKKWRLSEETWELLGADDELVRAVEEERTRRVRSGATKRELAQAHVIRGPNVLAAIMDDPKANARHRVDSVKALDAIAAPESQATNDTERFVIQINMGSQDPKDTLRFETEIPPRPSPIDNWETAKQLESTPPGKRDDGNDF